MKIRNERDANVALATVPYAYRWNHTPYRRPSQWASSAAMIALLCVFASIGAMLAMGV